MDILSEKEKAVDCFCQQPERTDPDLMQDPFFVFDNCTFVSDLKPVSSYSALMAPVRA